MCICVYCFNQTGHVLYLFFSSFFFFLEELVLVPVINPEASSILIKKKKPRLLFIQEQIIKNHMNQTNVKKNQTHQMDQAIN